MICPNGHRTDMASRFCGVCGAVVAPAGRQLTGQTWGAPRSTPPWVPAVAALGVAGLIAGVVAAVLVLGGDRSAAEPEEVPIPVSTESAEPLVAPVPSDPPPPVEEPVAESPAGAPAAPVTIGAPVVPVPAPLPAPAPVGDCAADVRAASGDDQASVHRTFRTEGFDIQICVADGGYWYYGRSRTTGADIALAATATAGGYQAPNGDTVYSIDAAWLVVCDGGETLVEQPVLTSR